MSIDLGEITGSKASKQQKKESVQVANGLSKDAFMKLFLEQLKNQDPTSPMETDKIITQTAQLTQVEMQEENKKTMKEVAQAMKSSQDTNKSLQDFQKEMKKSLEILNMGMEDNTNATTQGTKANTLNAVSMIGKIAETDIMGLNVSGNGENHFSLYFDNKINASQGNPIIEILNKNSEIIRTIPLNNKDGQQGYIDFTWDGKDMKGKMIEPGSYKIRAFYNLDSKTKQYDETRIGRGEVQSIIYDKGTPLMRLGDNIVPVQNALEFYPKGEAHKSIETTKTEASKAMSAFGDKNKTQSLSEKYENLIKEREAKLASESLSESSQSEESLQKEALERQKIAEQKKYEKMLDSAEKGKQLEKKDLDKLDKKVAIAGALESTSRDSTQAKTDEISKIGDSKDFKESGESRESKFAKDSFGAIKDAKDAKDSIRSKNSEVSEDSKVFKNPNVTGDSKNIEDSANNNTFAQKLQEQERLREQDSANNKDIPQSVNPLNIMG